MTQYVFPDLVSPTSGPLLRATLTNWYNAEISNNSGNIAPVSPVLGSKWMDTSAYPIIRLKIYDGAQWVTISSIDASTHTALAGAGLYRFDESLLINGAALYYDADSGNHRYWSFGSKTASTTINSGAGFGYGSVIVGAGKMYSVYNGQTAIYTGIAATPTIKTWGGGMTYIRQGGAVYFDSKLWILGGNKTGSDYSTEVWYSSDEGETWTLATNTPGWSGRYGHSALVFDGKIWVIGGFISTGYATDAWYSADGVNWTCSTAAIAAARFSKGGFVKSSKMHIIGGNTLYSSSDGITWTSAAAPVGYQDSPAGVIDGYAYFATTSRYIYYSRDLVNWISTYTPNSVPVNFITFDSQLLIVSFFSSDKIQKVR
jgi:hypothetical protein